MASRLPVQGLTDDALWARVARQARCADCGLDPDQWYPVSIEPARARCEAATAIAVCTSCPVRAECLELSLRQWDIGRHGVWGGLVATDRAHLRRLAARRSPRTPQERRVRDDRAGAIPRGAGGPGAGRGHTVSAGARPRGSAVRGCLRIYLGYAPGAGTTCALLSEGRRGAERGTDPVEARIRAGTARQGECPRTMPEVRAMVPSRKAALAWAGVQERQRGRSATRCPRPPRRWRPGSSSICRRTNNGCSRSPYWTGRTATRASSASP